MNNTMTIEQAKAIAVETHKGIHAECTYRDIVEAAKVLMVATLKASTDRITSSALYAATKMNSNISINCEIQALKELVKEERVTDTHEMVDGYKSTHFHTLANEWPEVGETLEKSGMLTVEEL